MSMQLEIPLYATVIDAATPGEMRAQIDRHVGHGLEVLGWWADPWSCDQINRPLWQTIAHVTVGIKESKP